MHMHNQKVSAANKKVRRSPTCTSKEIGAPSSNVYFPTGTNRNQLILTSGSYLRPVSTRSSQHKDRYTQKWGLSQLARKSGPTSGRQRYDVATSGILFANNDDSGESTQLCSPVRLSMFSRAIYSRSSIHRLRTRDLDSMNGWACAFGCPNDINIKHSFRVSVLGLLWPPEYVVWPSIQQQ